MSLRRIPLWLFAVLMVLVAGGWSVWNGYTDYQQTLEHEYQLLEVRARQREARIAGAIRSVDLMLGSIIADLRDRPGLSASEQNALLKSYTRLLPELRNLLVIDASGRIRAESNESSIGRDTSTREYFKLHRDQPDQDRFHISRPFKAFSGVIATTLSRGMRDRDGRFAGVVLASLDAEYFYEILKLPASMGNARAALINRDGDIISIAPPSDVVGKNLTGGIAFTEHFAANQKTTRHLNTPKLQSEASMAVFNDLQGLPLTVIVSRNYDDVIAGWRRSMFSHVAGFLLLAGTALFFYRLAIRRHRSLIVARRQIAERELELRTIIDTDPECIKQVAADGSLLDINRSGLAMVEADSAEQVLGRKIQDLAVPEWRKDLMALLASTFSGESGSLTYEIRGLKGGRRWLESHAVPLRTAEGKIRSVGKPRPNSTGTDTTSRNLCSRVPANWPPPATRQRRPTGPKASSSPT